MGSRKFYSNNFRRIQTINVMINLKLTQVFIINSNDFDNLVVETLGISNFESIAQVWWNNNSAYLSENINKKFHLFKKK